MGSAVTVATVAGAGYQMAVVMCRSHGIGVYLSPRRMPAVFPLRAPLTTRRLPLALEYMAALSAAGFPRASGQPESVQDSAAAPPGSSDST